VIGLDSNILVRYLAQDDPAQAARATNLIERKLSDSRPGYVSLPALVEVIWVMVRCYGADRALVRSTVEGLLSSASLRVQEAEQVWKALETYAKGKADFSDALIAHLGLAAGCSETYTFDAAAAREPGFSLLR
jgi:predicted nucleic-acid-binding protein